MGIETTQKVFKQESFSNRAEMTRYQINNPDGSTIGVSFFRSLYKRRSYTINWDNYLQDPGIFFENAFNALQKINTRNQVEDQKIQAFFYPIPVDGQSKLTETDLGQFMPRFRLDPESLNYAYLSGSDCYFHYTFDVNGLGFNRLSNLRVQSFTWAPQELAELVANSSRNTIDVPTLERVLDFVGKGQID